MIKRFTEKTITFLGDFMEQKLKNLMAEIFRMQLDEITEELSFKETEVWDSFRHMELIVAIETEFNIELAFEEIISMKNITEIKRILKEKRVDI